MITFRHGANDFKNLMLECSGEVPAELSASAAALMAAAEQALRLRNTPRLNIETRDKYMKIRCEYNQHTAEIAMMTICGFEWLAEQMPEEVKVERVHSREV